MNDYAVTIRAKVLCRQCGGDGMIYGPMQRVSNGVGGTMMLRDERDCQQCNGRGFTVEMVELDAAALIALGNAIRTVQSAEQRSK